MSIFDTILLILLFGFIFYGLFFGLIRMIGVFVGVFVGAFIVGHYYLVVADWLEPFFFGYNNLGKVLVFILLFGIVNKIVVLLFVILDKFFNVLSIIPFLKTINRLAGAILGFFVGSLSLGLILYIISKYALLTNWFGQWLTNSQMAPFLLKYVNILMPLLPEALKMLQSII